jgi:hypothetical protein
MAFFGIAYTILINELFAAFSAFSLCVSYIIPLSLNQFLARARIPGGDQMDMIGKFASRLSSELMGFIDWALRNWAVGGIFLVALIYWAGRQRRLDRHHL